MTKVVILKFSTYGELQNQLATWVKMLPSIFSKLCQLENSSEEDHWNLIFEPKSVACYQSLHLHHVVRKIESSQYSKPLIAFKPLWMQLPWEIYNCKQEAYYCLLPIASVPTLVRKAFQLRIFDIQYHTFKDQKILLKIMFSPLYLVLWIQEHLACPVYWLDSHGTFMTFGKRHPLDSFWAKDDDLRLVNEKEILNLGNTDLRFRNISSDINWKYDLTEKSLVSVEDKLDIEIRISLRKDETNKEPRPSLWFYERNRRQELEDWVIHLSKHQREEYLLLNSESPFDGYYLKIKNDVRPELVNPPPTSERFCLLFEGESIYIPNGLRLEPDIPFSEFQKIFNLQIGISLVFWQEENSLGLLRLEEVRFDELQSLVNYVLSDYEDQILKTRSKMIFQDPLLVMFDYNDPGEIASKVITEEFNSVGDLDSEKLVIEESEQTLEVIQNNAVDSAINRESNRTEKSLILRQICELQSELIRDPMNDTNSAWLRLGHLEYTLGNQVEAIACLELGMFVMRVGSRPDNEFRQALFLAYQSLQDWNDDKKISELTGRSSEDDFSPKELIYLGYYLLAYRDNLSDENTAFFTTTYLVALENNLNELPLGSLCVISFHALLKSDSNQYLLLKIKDYVLYALFDRGLYKASDLPHFLVDRKSFDLNNEAVQNFYDQLDSHFQGLGPELESMRNSAMFRMVFAVGYAHQKNSSMVNTSLEKAGRLVKLANDSVLRVLCQCYEEVAFKVLNEDGLGVRATEVILDGLTQAERYKANRLIDKSLILKPGQSEDSSDLINHDIVGLRDRTDGELVSLIPQKLKAIEMESNIPRERLSYKRKQLFCAILDSLPRLGETFTFQILEEIYREYNALNSLEHRGSVLGKMLSLAYLFERKDWMKTLYSDFLILTDEIEAYRLKAMTELLQPVVEYFPKMVPHEECLALVQKILSRLQQDINSQKIRILLIRVLDSIDQSELSQSQLKLVLDAYLNKKIDDQQSRLDLFQFLLLNARNYTFDLKTWLSEQLLNSFEKINDHLSVNEHFSLSKVQAMEFMIYTNPNEEEFSPELNKFMMEFEFVWKKRFFDWLRAVGANTLEV